MLFVFSMLAHAQDAPPPPQPTDEVVVEVDEPQPTCADRSWQGEWPDASERIAQEKGAEITALEAWAFPQLTPEDEAERRGIRTEGLVIIQGGQLLYERYDRGFTAEKPHLTWSASKTFTNALAGIAIRDGLLALDDSICDHVSATNPDNCAITVGDLLAFGSGLQWRETYEGLSPTTSSVISMLYGDGIHDMAAFVTGAQRAHEPGSAWQYSSGDTTLLSAVLGAAMAPRYGDDYPWAALFDPLGMQGVTWEQDGAGTFVGSSYVFGTPRALAQFGQLWLDDGCWDGERILPEGWVGQSIAVSSPMQQTVLDRGGGTQGWQVWLNQPVDALGDTASPWPESPTDAYAAQGHWKQRIFVIPSHDMVIVRVGDDRDGSLDNDVLLRLALALGEGVQRQPASPSPHPAPEGAGVLAESVPLKFDTGLLRIGANYGAKLACSCRFVMEQDEAYCRAWVRASPDIVKIRFDDDEKVVTAKALGVVRSQARWVNERAGCVLE